MVHICIIGAGASGLAAIRHVSRTEGLTGIVFEQTADIGGVWVYEDPKERAKSKISYSVMYRDCRTNLPKGIMQFLDFPFKDGNKESFVKHQEVRQYLNDYADAFNLRKYIKLNTQILEVRPAPPRKISINDLPRGLSPHWQVKVKDLITEEEQYLKFDAVMVCSGHHQVSWTPEIQGMELFKGAISTASEYRYPEAYKGKRVVLLGGGPSAIDLALELAEVNKEVLISHKSVPFKSPMPSNVIQKPWPSSVSATGVKFENGDAYECDEIIYCTGYLYDFPYLTKECNVDVKAGKRVDPLYRHVVHMTKPTLSFIALNFHCIPFYLADIQVRWYLKFLTGELKLPTLEAMQKDRHKEGDARSAEGYAPHHGHRLAALQYAYYKKLAEEAGFAHEIKPVTEKVMQFVTNRRFASAIDYKKDKINVIDDKHFTYELCGAKAKNGK